MTVTIHSHVLRIILIGGAERDPHWGPGQQIRQDRLQSASERRVFKGIASDGREGSRFNRFLLLSNGEREGQEYEEKNRNVVGGDTGSLRRFYGLRGIGHSAVDRTGNRRFLRADRCGRRRRTGGACGAGGQHRRKC